VSAPTPGRALDLEAIEATLQDLQSHFPEINKLLKSRRDTIDDGLIANMMTGYELVDNLVTRHLDLFAMGNLKLFLEMNAVVLCGRDEQSRTQAASHLAATEQRFYEQEDGGIRDIVEWYELHRAKSPWERAAGVYVRMLSEPELFIEGNHRTGALVMSYILGARGSSPVRAHRRERQGVSRPLHLDYRDPQTQPCRNLQIAENQAVFRQVFEGTQRS
jgi:hypothetical protein